MRVMMRNKESGLCLLATTAYCTLFSSIPFYYCFKVTSTELAYCIAAAEQVTEVRGAEAV